MTDLRQQVVAALLDYYGTNNVHPDDQNNMDDLYDVVFGVIEARDKAHAEEFRRLAEESRASAGRLKIDDFQNHALYEGQIRAYRQAAQMLERPSE